MTTETFAERTRIPFLAFFPAKLLSMTLYSAVILTGLFAAFWPWGKEMSHFLRIHQGPVLSFPLFAAAVIMYSYMQFRCGRGELARTFQEGPLLDETFDRELEQRFFHSGQLMCLLHAGVFLLPLLPPLILAVSVSGLSQRILLLSIALVWMSGMMFRAAGILLYRLWGSASTLGYFLGRAFFGIFLLVTPVYVPYLSPLRLLYSLHRNQDVIGGTMTLRTACWICLGTMAGMTIVALFAARVVEAKNG